MSNWKKLIADAKELLDIGAMTQEEFEDAKLKAFALRDKVTTQSTSSSLNSLGEMGTMMTPSAESSDIPSHIDNMGTMVGKMNGDIIGNHKIVGVIGEGGMGSVYRGRHTIEAFAKAEGDVAIKMILPSLAKDEDFKKRFIREASLGKKLNHPNIAKVVSIHSANEDLALVMEYIDGKELKDLIPEGGMSVDEVVRLLKPIASALDYLHEQGVVHRDMKPANVRVKPDGTPVILDFGIAKDTNETDSGMTQTGTAMGTQTYMAPEQMDAKRVTGAADQYALAMMAYQLLSGRLPWDEGLSNVRIAIAKMTGDFNSLEELDGVSKSISEAVLKGLSLDPIGRFESCTKFIESMDNRPTEEQLRLEAAKRKEEQDHLEQEQRQIQQELFEKERQELKERQRKQAEREAELETDRVRAQEELESEKVRLAQEADDKEQSRLKELEQERAAFEAEKLRLAEETEATNREQERLEQERQKLEDERSKVEMQTATEPVQQVNTTESNTPPTESTPESDTSEEDPSSKLSSGRRIFLGLVNLSHLGLLVLVMVIFTHLFLFQRNTYERIMVIFICAGGMTLLSGVGWLFGRKKLGWIPFITMFLHFLMSVCIIISKLGLKNSLLDYHPMYVGLDYQDVYVRLAYQDVYVLFILGGLLTLFLDLKILKKLKEM